MAMVKQRAAINEKHVEFGSGLATIVFPLKSATVVARRYRDL